MFKVNNKDQNDVCRVSLLVVNDGVFIVNFEQTYFTPYFSVSIINFEQVFTRWEDA